jgi:beta-carotene 3-hydroxylase
MATGVWITSSASTHCFKQKTYQIPTPISKSISYSQKICGISSTFRKIQTLGVCLVMEKKTEDVIQVDEEIKSADGIKNQITGASRAAERSARKRFERYTYLVAAIMSSLGVTSMAAISVYYRFSWQMEVHKLRLSIN